MRKSKEPTRSPRLGHKGRRPGHHLEAESRGFIPRSWEHGGRTNVVLPTCETTHKGKERTERNQGHPCLPSSGLQPAEPTRRPPGEEA